MKEIISIKTDYNVLSSMIKLPDLFSYAVTNNINTLGIVDDNLCYVAEFLKLCQKYNIKPVIGLEVNYQNYKIYLYAKNEQGYKELLKINTYIIENEFNKDLLTNDILSIIPFKSKELLKEIPNSYIAYQTEEEKNEALKLTPNIVYFNLTLSLTKENTKYLNYLNMIKENKTYASYNDIDYSPYYLKIEDIHDFTSQIDIKITYSKNLIPHYDDTIENSYNFLEALAIKGLTKRLNGNIPENYKKRLMYELKVIKSMNYVDYFLIVYDYVKYAIKNNIYVGPGRGSAVGSLVTYSLGITSIDPLKYNLLFERFLNPERITMPDIDIDFDATKREEIIAYVKERYGKENVMPVMTYGTLTTKAALLSVSKILDVDISILNKYIDPKKTLKENLTKDLIKILNNNKDIKEVYYVAMKIEGIKKHISTNAAGVVICKENLDNVIPIIKNGDNYLAGFTKDYLEDIGLLKMDFLAIKNLTTISDILNDIPEKINLNNIDLNDEAVYKMFSEAKTDGIFQFESLGMKNLLLKIKPTNFKDIIVSLALIRPGANAEIDSYAKRKNGKEEITYIDDSLSDILKDTYGIIVYQEQIMQILRLVASYSFSEADLIRRAISKKNEQIILSEKSNFIERAIKNGYTKEKSTEIFDLIIKFAEYGFNKSHSVGYALIAYQMMYLKCHYMPYFYKTLLNDNLSSNKKTKEYIDILKGNNLHVIKPSINLSTDKYIYKEAIIMPLTSIKDITKDIALEISKNAPYNDFYDFISSIYHLKLKQGIIENLIYAGALDCFHETKQTLINNISSALIYSELINELDKTLINKPIIETFPEYDKTLLMQKEYELYGFYISNHPASKYICPKSKDLPKYFDKFIEVTVLIENIKSIKTKKGDNMAFLDLSDDTGKISCTVFPKKTSYLNELKIGDIVKIKGQVQKRLDKYQIILENLTKFS